MSLTSHIAIAVDFSQPSEIAVRAGLALARICGNAPVTVVHAAQQVVRPSHGAALRAQLEAVEQRITESAQRAVRELCAAQGGSPQQLTQEIVHGRPAEVIPAAMERIGATLLVLGTHARTGLKRLFVGSVAEQILRRLKIPALVTQIGEDGVPPDRELDALEHVLIAVDDPASAGVLLRTALELLEASGRRDLRVVLAHVVEPLPAWALSEVQGVATSEMLEHAALGGARSAEELEPLIAEAAARGFVAESRLLHGWVSEALLELAKTLPAQLIVAGTHGIGRAPLDDLGSTIHQILRSADVSVLVVPTGTEAAPAAP